MRENCKPRNLKTSRYIFRIPCPQKHRVRERQHFQFLSNHLFMNSFIYEICRPTAVKNPSLMFNDFFIDSKILITMWLWNDNIFHFPSVSSGRDSINLSNINLKNPRSTFFLGDDIVCGVNSLSRGDDHTNREEGSESSGQKMLRGSRWPMRCRASETQSGSQPR